MVQEKTMYNNFVYIYWIEGENEHTNGEKKKVQNINNRRIWVKALCAFGSSLVFETFL